MDDEQILEEILIIGDFMQGVDVVLNREETRINGGRIVQLDLSGLRLDELSPTINYLDELEVLNLKDNSLIYLPDTITELKHLRELQLEGNPINSIPNLGENVIIDLDLPTYDVHKPESKEEIKKEVQKKMKERAKNKEGVLFTDKVCSWCEQAVGYRKEVQRTDSRWGFTTHVSTVLVCLNCSYMHQFYSGRSLFDFE